MQISAIAILSCEGSEAEAHDSSTTDAYHRKKTRRNDKKMRAKQTFLHGFSLIN